MFINISVYCIENIKNTLRQSEGGREGLRETIQIQLLSDRNKMFNDEQRRQRNNPQIKIDNAENSLFPKKMKCIMINNYYKGLRIL